jgi:hypothetical protein
LRRIKLSKLRLIFIRSFWDESLVFNEDKANRVSQLITKQITNVQCAMLQVEVTDAEIKATVFAMKNEKAPGPDGFSVEFFKKAWSIVDQDVIVAKASKSNKCYNYHTGSKESKSFKNG